MRGSNYKSVDEFFHEGKPLREILHSHKRWTESGGREGTKARLMDARLLEPVSKTVIFCHPSATDSCLRCKKAWRNRGSGAELYAPDWPIGEFYEFLRPALMVDLKGWDLRRINFHGAWLSSANLSETRLFGADFYMAQLVSVDLSGADLSATNIK